MLAVGWLPHLSDKSTTEQQDCKQMQGNTQVPQPGEHGGHVSTNCIGSARLCPVAHLEPLLG